MLRLERSGIESGTPGIYTQYHDGFPTIYGVSNYNARYIELTDELFLTCHLSSSRCLSNCSRKARQLFCIFLMPDITSFPYDLFIDYEHLSIFIHSFTVH